MSKEDIEVYEFAGFRLDARERTLAREGKPLSLPAKAFDLLLFFVRNDGRLLHKREIMEAVWPEAAVEESNLTNRVALLRNTLGRKGRAATLIETVPRHGYRFHGDVRLLKPAPPTVPMVVERITVTRVVTDELEEPTTDETDDGPVIELAPEDVRPELPPVPDRPTLPPVPTRRRAGVVGSILLTVMAVAGGAGWWVFRQAPEGREPVAAPRFVPLTSFEGDKRRPVFSPDGRQVAFEWDETGSGNYDICVIQVGGSTPKRVTDSPSPEFHPAWSPDGRRIAFLRRNNGFLELIVKTLDSGAERSLGLADGGLDWSPDGKSLAIQETRTAASSGLSLLDVETGNRSVLTTPPEPFSDIRPVFSPDGKSLAFLRMHHAFGNPHVVPTAGGASVQLTFDDQQIDNLAWLPKTDELIFASNRTGAVSFWRIPRAGGEARPVSPVPGQCDNLAVDRSGTRLVFRQRNPDGNIRRLDLPASGQPAAKAAVPVVKSTKMDDSPDFSPDGKRLVFSSNRSGTWEIWMCGSDGSNPVRLSFFDKGIAGSPRWSPDGRSVVFDWGHDGRKFLYVADIGGSAPVRLTDGSTEAFLPGWSPDGQWIYFCSNAGGVRNIWKMPSRGGTPVQVTRSGGWESQASPDGKHLYFVKSRTEPAVFRIDLATGNEEAVPELSNAATLRYWAVAASGIAFAVPGREAWTINFLDLATRKAHILGTLQSPPVLSQRGLAISRDGKTVAFVQDDRFGSDLTMVENFR